MNYIGISIAVRRLYRASATVIVHNAIRVIPNGIGSTVTFTIMRLSGVSEQKFDDDAKWVERVTEECT